MPEPSEGPFYLVSLPGRAGSLLRALRKAEQIAAEPSELLVPRRRRTCLLLLEAPAAWHHRMASLPPATSFSLGTENSQLQRI